MKKTAIALAIAAIAAAPMAAQADAGAYASVRVSLVNTDPDTAADASWDFQDEASRFGLKGKEDLGNGMYAFGRYEFGVNADDTTILDKNRLSFVGFGGDFGEVSIGRQWAPFYLNVSSTVDQFNALGANLISVGSSSDANGRMTIRTSDSLKYAKSFGPVSFAGLVQMRGTDDDAADRIEATVSYKGGPLGVSVGFIQDAESNGDDEVFGAAVSYAVNDMFTVKGLFEAHETAGGAERELAEVYASAGLGGGLKLHGALGSLDNNGTDVTEMVFGVQKSLSKSSRVWVEYQSVDTDGGNNPTALSIGARHDW